jgi:hypothetical protein
MTGVRWLLAGAFSLALGGCSLTDDYYLEKASGAGSSAGGGASGQGAVAGSASTMAAEGGASAGTPSVLIGEAGSPAACIDSGDERCDGRDNDCNGRIDDDACTEGCVGFVVPGQPEHGYSYCDASAAKAWRDARDACVADGMRLLWLESAQENDAVSAKLAQLGEDAEILFGANDTVKEGEWCWGPSEPFWRGNAQGAPVGDAFTAWTEGVPNDENNDEDCGVLHPESATWGDRACDQQFAYACEQLDYN